MKKLLLLLPIALLTSCGSDDNATSDSGSPDATYKQRMRDFVIAISQNAKAVNPNFAIIPQNGIELVSATGEEDGGPAMDYLNAIDGNGQEDLFYGYDNDDQPTPTEANQYLRSFLDLSKQHGKKILVTDYCSTPSKMADSYAQNQAAGYISYAAPERALNVLPTGPLQNENGDDINSLSQAKNFTFFINPDGFSTKTEFIFAVNQTNYDVVIMDLFLNGEQFTASEIEQMKHKANGGKRLVISYMSIGEAEDYRYYWNASWNMTPPNWLTAENPDWPGNYKVKYWDADWKQFIFGNPDAYLSRITSANFDGVYLDIIDAFEYFENN